MAGTTKKLTQLSIDKLRPPKGRLVISDLVLPGLQLRYWPNRNDHTRVDGSYSIRYWSPVTGKRTRLTIGSIHKYKLSEARGAARDLFRLIGEGQDPQLEKQRHRRLGEEPSPGTIDALTQEFDKRYLQEHRKDPAEARRTLDRELLEHKPSWKDWPIAEITKGDIHVKLDYLKDQGKNYAANRLLESIRLLFKYAVQRGYIDTSPAEGIEKPSKEKPRRRVLTDSELRPLWNTFLTMGYPFGPLFQLLLLTGQRKSEVGKMTWAELDLDLAIWSLPTDRTKSERAYQIPLSSTSVDILRSLPRFTSIDYVFTGRESTGNPVSGFGRAADRAREMSGIEDWRLHDLRRTVRTRLGEIGTPPHIAELVLNHSVKGLQAVYDRYEYTKEKREALDKWAEYLRDIMEGEESKVVALR